MGLLNEGAPTKHRAVMLGGPADKTEVVTVGAPPILYMPDTVRAAVSTAEVRRSFYTTLSHPQMLVYELAYVSTKPAGQLPLAVYEFSQEKSMDYRRGD